MARIIGTNDNDTLIGSNRVDEINGNAGSDRIEGKNGNDVLRGDAGDDTLIGGAGNDVLIDSSGNNVLEGDAGNDSFYLSASKTTPSSLITQTVDGGKDYDYLSVDFSQSNEGITSTFNSFTNEGLITSGNNQVSYKNIERLKIVGTAYDDQIFGSNGNDTILSGKGDDYISLDYSTAPYSLITKKIDGETGNDRLSLYLTSATSRIISTFNTTTNEGSIKVGTNLINYKNIEGLEIRGTIYDDYIVGTNGNDYLFGGSSGNDTSYGDDQIFGGAGNDYLSVDYSTSNNTLIGGTGNDNLSADYSKGNNLLSGGNGNDNLSVSNSSGNNTLIGGAGDDSLSGDSSKSNNLLSGGDGNDNLSIGRDFFNNSFPNSGNNTLIGGAGDDNLSVDNSSGNNLLDGGDGNDTLFVSSYYDYFGRNTPGFGNNTIIGGNGNDSIYIILETSPASLKVQTVDGGAGKDVLKFYYAYPTEGITSTFDASTKKGSITAGNNLINYKNIEQLEISGTSYDDQIIGSSGNDSLDGGINGNDLIDGGAGEDLLSFYGYQATAGITSTFNATTNQGTIKAGSHQISYKNIERLEIVGTRYDDQIVGSNGNDSLDSGDDGNDTIDGGAGDDLLSFINYLRSERITSTFDVTTNQGTIKTGSNQVSYKNIERLNILGTAYDDYIVGANGNDVLSGGGNGNDQIYGGAGDDSLSTDYSNGNNLLDGGNGNDNIFASGSFDEYRGELYINTTSGNNTLIGGAGDDRLIADYSSGNNLLIGGDANDYLSASGNDLYTEYGVYSTTGNNTLIGGTGDDRLIVDNSSGNSLLIGGDGNDHLSAVGAVGNNSFNGGLGNDILTGGKGADTFIFESYNQGLDRLENFSTVNDRIQISSAGFGGGLLTGTLKTSQFTLGTSTTTSEERFIYNSATGALYFDLDGSASGFTQVQFAQLSTGLSLTNNNFVVV
ncbi:MULTISPECIES: calcium-binding protein [unclassified Nostoc]|uniref:beta strand repeat-containing protein n=1 Tax=unclassified Nostoc TaxID=2593658 RepID=UPI002AD3C78F|nr:calcium-binding protein [Nostoc sp. DedQUE03]MDZ7971437.1 calcium-binding protein [Nostoc sp. DedQUE03]MDZ8046292.1 calcium-binding protein [Nostoc sp. DedQUE02]